MKKMLSAGDEKPTIMARSGWLLKLGAAMLSLAAVWGMAVVDFVTGYDTAVSLLYIVPIVLAAWFSWRYVTLLAAILSGVSDVVMNFASYKSYTTLNAFNSDIQIAFFVIFAYAVLELKESQHRLKALSMTDPLTKLVNSRRFFEIGNAEVQRTLRYKRPFSLVYIDIDNFKAVNDTLGHSAGDALLCEISGKVKGTTRRTDTMARLGGDEFALMLPETGADAARAAVGRVQESLIGIRMSNGASVTFSMGVITNTGRPCTFDEIVSASDALMYEAKHSGKNIARYDVFE